MWGGVVPAMGTIRGAGSLAKDDKNARVQIGPPYPTSVLLQFWMQGVRARLPSRRGDSPCHCPTQGTFGAHDGSDCRLLFLQIQKYILERKLACQGIGDAPSQLF